MHNFKSSFFISVPKSGISIIFAVKLRFLVKNNKNAVKFIIGILIGLLSESCRDRKEGYSAFDGEISEPCSFYFGMLAEFSGRTIVWTGFRIVENIWKKQGVSYCS